MTASMPASARCWRHARADREVLEIAHDLPVVEARVADEELGLRVASACANVSTANSRVVQLSAGYDAARGMSTNTVGG